MLTVPFARPHLDDAEISAVVKVLQSGWLTSGPQVRKFEEAFATSVVAKHAVSVNSATAALHLGVEAQGLRRGQAVLVPTLTFAATAEVVRYQGATPILVDCEADTLNVDFEDAARKLLAHREGRLLDALSPDWDVVGVIPVHVGGLVVDVDATSLFAQQYGLWTVEDAAHAFPAAWRRPGDDGDAPWVRCGEDTAGVTCFSFYANKTITTGEGGMAVTADAEIASRMRRMSLHGLSNEPWNRHGNERSWDYKIVAPGFKYNLTDIAAAMGIQQLARAEQMRVRREQIADAYLEAWSEIAEVELPPRPSNRIHAWHLFPIRLRLETLTVDRSSFMGALKDAGVGCSVHWRPLHLQPYYQETFGWRPEHCPVATREWERLVSLPIFSAMTDAEVDHVAATVQKTCQRLARI